MHYLSDKQVCDSRGKLLITFKQHFFTILNEQTNDNIISCSNLIDSEILWTD